MTQSRFDINRIINMEKWSTLQDSLAHVTRMAIITVDYKGIPVTEHSRCQSFCRVVRQDSRLSLHCQKCDARGGLEAVRLNRPYIYLCHFNILDIAIPIMIENQYIGAIMAGQVRLRNGDGPLLEQIVSRPPSLEASRKFDEIREDYHALPVMSYEEVLAITDMLFHLSTYIVQEAIHKDELLLMYKKALSIHPVNPANSIQSIQKELSNALIESNAQKYATKPFMSSNSTLHPAFDYIYAHKNENFTLQAMSRLCHISPSYFSRIFARETGEHFSIFIPRLKIEWAKQLLETTALPINQISEDLGFCDAGYFIKKFKRFEGITPTVYRKVYKGK